MNSTPLWLSSLAIAAAGGWLAATMFAAPATGKEPRFPQLTMDQLDEKQKPLGEQIMKVSSVGIGGPYNPMMRSPVLGQRLFDLFHYLRWQTSVPTKLNEFAILIIGRQWRSQVEWFAHAPLAAKAGLSPDIIAELKASKRPSNMAEDEARGVRLRHRAHDHAEGLRRDLCAGEESLQRPADRRPHRGRRQLRDGRDDAGDGGGDRAAGQGGAVQAGRAVASSRHCEERSDEAIQTASAEKFWIASLRSQ